VGDPELAADEVSGSMVLLRVSVGAELTVSLDLARSEYHT